MSKSGHDKNRGGWLVGALVSAAAGAVGVIGWQKWQRQARPSSGSATADRINDDFHRAYDDTRGHAELDAPVLVALPDELVLVRGHTRRSFSYTSKAVHFIKSVTHAPVGLYAALQPQKGMPSAPLQPMLAAADARLAALELDGAPPVVVDNLRRLVDTTRAYLASLQKAVWIDEQGLAAFAREMGPLLQQAIADATHLQLDALDAATRALVADLSDTSGLIVVVTGNHQARQRSLPMQYFGAVIGHHRVLYGEGLSDEEAALELVGTHRLDRAMATAFFGDAQRLQRDILGDAAEAQLKERDLAKL